MTHQLGWLNQQIARARAHFFLRGPVDDQDLHDALLEAPEALRRLARTSDGRLAIKAITELHKQAGSLQPSDWRSIGTLCRACGAKPTQPNHQ